LKSLPAVKAEVKNSSACNYIVLAIKTSGVLIYTFQD
jgi:hypothetical protein